MYALCVNRKPIEFMEHEIPFTEVIDAEGANENCICDAEFALCQTDFALRSDTDGDMRLLDVDLISGVDPQFIPEHKYERNL